MVSGGPLGHLRRRIPDTGNRVLTNTRRTIRRRPARSSSASFRKRSTPPKVRPSSAPSDGSAKRTSTPETFWANPTVPRRSRFDEHDYTDDFRGSWLYRYLESAAKANADVRPKDAVAVGADRGISRASVFRLFDKLANAGLAMSVDGIGFPRVTHWRIVGETTGPVMESGETTETTGADLRKQGETTEPLWDHSETTEKTAPDQENSPGSLLWSQ